MRYRGDIEQLLPAFGALCRHRLVFGLGFAHESSSAYHRSKSNSEVLNFLERILGMKPGKPSSLAGSGPTGIGLERLA